MDERRTELLGREGYLAIPIFPKRSIDMLMNVALDLDRFVWFEAIEDSLGDNYSVATVEIHPIHSSAIPSSGVWNLKVLYKNKRFHSAYLVLTEGTKRFNTLTDALACLIETPDE